MKNEKVNVGGIAMKLKLSSCLCASADGSVLALRCRKFPVVRKWRNRARESDMSEEYLRVCSEVTQ